MDGNAKNDLEHSTEKAVRVSAKSGTILTRLFAKFILWANRHYQKRFSSSMRALKKDGPTKELSVSPALTKEEAKEIIAKAHENGILIGVKKMQPDGDTGKNQSLHKQEKLAKNEIKFEKWNERRKKFQKVPWYGNHCSKKANRFKELSKEDNLKNKDDKYIVICNKSRLSFLNEQLEAISKRRLQDMTSNETKDMDKDVDGDYEPMVSRDVNIFPNELNKVGEDYGSCMVKDYKKNYCIQKISKLEYCEIREQLFELKSHGACVINDNEVMVAFNSDDLDEYRRIAPTDKPIKEFGSNGAKDVESVSNADNIMQLTIANEKDFLAFKEKYKSKDFVATHNADGTISAIVREEDTKDLVDDVKKKSSTADLLKEANEFAEKNKETKEPEVNIEVPDKEQELDC